MRLLALLLILLPALAPAHPVDQFKGSWQGPCTQNGKPIVPLQLVIQDTQDPHRLTFTMTYGENEVRNYFLLLDPQDPTRIILDEKWAQFEERIEGNLLFGLLQVEQVYVHSSLTVTENAMQVQLTGFNLSFQPQWLQQCLLTLRGSF